MNNKGFDYFTPSGLWLCGTDDKGNLIIKKSSYHKMVVEAERLHPDKDADSIIYAFIDYWQSHILKVKESRFKSPTTIWKYKKIWKELGLIV